MAKIKHALFGFSASGSISNALTYLKRMRHQIVEKKPELEDSKTEAQLNWRHMFNKAVALWHALSAAEKCEWESAARPKHMTGYAWFISQALRPNPGLYLPLQGGTMAGIIQMNGYPIQTLKDPVAAQDGDTKAARDAAIAAAIGGSLTCDIYGYDGLNWQKLLVESAAQHNLRVRLYHGANAIDSDTIPATFAPSKRALYTISPLFLWGGASWARIGGASGGADNLASNITALMVSTYLYGYDGSNWDRLRTYGTGILKVGRAEIDSTTLRKVAAGAVVGGARKLFWLSCSPDAPGAEWELSDAIGGGQPVVLDHFDSDKSSEVLIFDPPMKFATGIWIEKFDHIKSMTFCYI